MYCIPFEIYTIIKCNHIVVVSVKNMINIADSTMTDNSFQSAVALPR